MLKLGLIETGGFVERLASAEMENKEAPPRVEAVSCGTLSRL